MTLISNVFVLPATADTNDANTNAAFDLIVRGPGGYEARAAFGDLKYDERERGRTDMYEFIFDTPFDWEPALGWTVSAVMTRTHDGWLPDTIFVIGKVASDVPQWVVMGAHRPWPRHAWFDRGPRHRRTP